MLKTWVDTFTHSLLHHTNPYKVFLECGIGRKNTKGKWSIVNGMVRIGRKGMKKSVARKKIKKIPKNTLIEVYVSRIQLEEGRFEVCLNRDEALEKGNNERRIPASSLNEGDELSGVVKNVTPYGVFVDVNANRNGLVHITKVAKQNDGYIHKEDGLRKYGLGRGSKVYVRVLRNEKKRLELDLVPPPVVEEEEILPAADEMDDTVASNDMSEDEAAAWAAYGTADVEDSSGTDDILDDEAAMWAAYAAPDYSSDNDEDEDDDEYDEDTDIEDALGIGSR